MSFLQLTIIIVFLLPFICSAQAKNDQFDYSDWSRIYV